MKELPYFKFYPGEYSKGDVTDCSMAAQGLFTNICGLYWSKGCNLTVTRVQRKFNTCSTELEELINDDIFDVYDDQISINFLDVQFEQFEELAKKKSRAGKASAKKRKGNTRSTRVQRVVNKEEERRGENNKIRSNRFTPPTILEVTQYCKSRNNSISPQKFIDHYTANGWIRGKTKIKDWKAAVRTWENPQDAVKVNDQSDFSDHEKN